MFAGDVSGHHLQNYRTGYLTDYQTDYRTDYQAASHQSNVNPKQIDHVNEQLSDSNLDRTDDADRRKDPENDWDRTKKDPKQEKKREDEREKDLERQHLLFAVEANDDRSFAKLDFNAYEGTEKHGKFNKEIKESKIQNNDHRTSSVSFSSTANSLRAADNRRPNPSLSRSPVEQASNRTSNRASNRTQRPSSSPPISAPPLPPQPTQLPAHLSEPFSEPIVYPLKNYSFLGHPNYPVSKSNRSSSVSSIFPDRRRTSSLLEKQLAWYELVGITMFNLLGSGLAGHQSSMNKKFKNQTNHAPPNASLNEIETVLSRPIASSGFGQQQQQNQQNDEHHTNRERAPYAAANNQTLGLMKNLKQSLPQCIIIGVRKAGTRAVLEYLTLNDRIRKADNEVHFFDNDERYALGLDYYRTQMPFTTRGQIGIEKSPAYFVTSTVPERIRTMNASIKLILIVRDPVTRLISDYTQLTHNKLLKLDDLMRISGSSNRQQQQQQRLENHLSEFLLSSASSSLSEFPVDKKTKFHSQPKAATNERTAVLGEPRSASAPPNNLGKKIEKRPHDENSIIEKSHLNADYYWSRIGSEPDYRKAEQLDEIEQDADAFVPSAKRQKRRAKALENGNRAASADEMNKLLSSASSTSSRSESSSRRRAESRPIDFKWNSNSKVIDSNANARSNGDRRSSAYRKTKRKIDRQADQPADRRPDRPDRKRPKAKRISRQALEQNEPNAEHRQTDDDEDEVYRAYRELSPDDEDVELDDHLDDDYLSSEHKQQIKKAPTNRDSGKTGSRPPAYNEHNNSPTGAGKQGSRSPSIEQAAKSNQDDHYHRRIPKFEELVIRNGQVNTNYRPVKTSIYSLYMDNWLRVSTNALFSFPLFFRIF